MPQPLLSVHTYSLRPLQGEDASGVLREGALLRADFGAEGIGYADLHPWPSLGDAPLGEELAALAKKQALPLGARALVIAHADARARTMKRSLFEGLTIPPSHFSLPWGGIPAGELARRLREGGFERVKLKVGRDSAGEIAFIKDLALHLSGSTVKLRLDANELFDRPRFETFLQILASGDTLDRVDFIEDPISFDPWVWDELSRDYQVHLALDRPLAKLDPRTANLAGVDVLVLKPALLDPAPWIERAHADLKRVVFTSSLDHPLGISAAAWEAARALKTHPLLVDAGGLLTVDVYQADAFSRALSHRGPLLESPGGTGLGFDDLLGRLEWKTLPA